MITRRLFSACGICAAMSGLAVSAASAQTPPAGATSGVTRTIINKTDLPGDRYVCVQVSAEIAPGATVADHTHPGIESAFILEGQGELTMRDQPARAIRSGDSFQIPAGTVHGVRNGDKAMKLAITYTVERDKPLASPAAS